MEDDDDNGDVVTVSQKMRDDLNESLHLAIYRMCQEYGETSGKSYSKAYVYALTELSMDLAARLAKDAECFAKHAKRPSSIRAEDILLCARHNERLHDELEQYLARYREQARASKPPPKS
ncbi:unnamed protein product (mitochondrion) [Plasmodiophora brassicae]|uniref:Centromere protein S n=1 Tax=Plasmodiophora brassicae TaxID=37360 RepID=A0A0G4INE3_PLABS|nr:hypothetical protein PBRA_005437 [Plasmodiophora brassicae]SPR01790.1 unnamed protein product [Plasmodiophora brassicae]